MASTSTMRKAQNRAAKGSTLLQRRSTLPTRVYYLSMAKTYSCVCHSLLVWPDAQSDSRVVCLWCSDRPAGPAVGSPGSSAAAVHHQTAGISTCVYPNPALLASRQQAKY